jgi:K+-transporting ATPase ATPase C chain
VQSGEISMLKPLLPTLRMTVMLAIVTGVIFPMVLAGLAHLLFPAHASGSLLRAADGHVLGSLMIGQNFAKPEYFHPRPSAAGSGYAAESSSGTNLGPTSAKLIEGSKDFASIKQLAEKFRSENGLDSETAIPPDAVTRSGSGLDPDISPENALLQAPRVAKARNLPLSEVTDLVKRHVQDRQMGTIGEPRVNVLQLNMAMDKTKS